MPKSRKRPDRLPADEPKGSKKRKISKKLSPLGYLAWDERGIILEADLAVAKLLGTNPSLLTDLPIRRFIEPVERELFDRHQTSLFQSGKRRKFNLQLVRSDGNPFFATLTCVCISDSENEAVKCLGHIIEISESKDFGEDLQKREKRYRHIVEDQAELICRYLHDGVLTFVNESYCRFFNRKKEDLIGHSFYSLIPAEEHEYVRQRIALLSKEQPSITHQHRVVLPDGSIGWQEWTNKIIFNKIGEFVEYQASGRDITEFKKTEEILQHARDELEKSVTLRTAELQEERQSLLEEIEKRNQIEEALRSSEQSFRGIFNNIGVGIALISPDMEILSMNPQMRKWFPDVDPVMKPICYRSFNDPPREMICSYCPTLKALQDGQLHESVADTPRGNETRHYGIIATPLRDKDGRIIAAIEMVTDITESVRMQQELKKSELRYRTVFETTGTAMMVVNEDMTVVTVNREFMNLSGYARSEVEGLRTWRDFFLKDDVDRMTEYHHQRRLNPEAVPSSYECHLRSRDGRIFDVFANVSMIPGTRLSVVSLMDISERKQALEELKKRERTLADKSQRLHEMNMALKVLLRQREEDQRELELKVLSNIRKLVFPFLEKLNLTPLSPIQSGYVDIISTNLNNVISPFLRTLSAVHMDFTPREIEVASLVREGKTAKEIARLLNLSIRSIEFHKDNIRKKLGLSNKKVSLRTHLMSLA